MIKPVEGQSVVKRSAIANRAGFHIHPRSLPGGQTDEVGACPRGCHMLQSNGESPERTPAAADGEFRVDLRTGRRGEEEAEG